MGLKPAPLLQICVCMYVCNNMQLTMDNVSLGLLDCSLVLVVVDLLAGVDSSLLGGLGVGVGGRAEVDSSLLGVEGLGVGIRAGVDSSLQGEEDEGGTADSSLLLEVVEDMPRTGVASALGGG